MAKRFDVFGYIVPDDDKWVYDLFDIRAVSYKEIRDFIIGADGEDIELYIDSPGGVVRIGSDIYSELRKYEGKSTAYIMGVSASATSFMMLGVQNVVASPTSRIMIHNASMIAEGNYKDMETAKQQLIKADESIINAYQIKTGKSRDELRALLDKTSWFTAQEGLEIGFIDEIDLKEGESLDDYKISAAMLPALANGDVLSLQKIHEFAQKYKDDKSALEKIQAELKPDESGGEGRPVSNTDEQSAHFREIRKKIYNR